MNVHAIVLFDSLTHQPIEHKIYAKKSSRFENKFITEFVDFGRKEFIQKLKADEDNFVIQVGNGSVLIYITIVDNFPIGLAMLLSNLEELNDTPHIVSRKIINDFITYHIIPDYEDILRLFTQKALINDIQVTKKVLLRTISKVMERGEKIEDLVEKTDTLSQQSKLFFTNARRFNSCCWIFPKPRWAK